VKFEDHFTGMKANEKKITDEIVWSKYEKFWVENCPNFRDWELINYPIA